MFLIASQATVSLSVKILFACLLLALIVCLAMEEKLHAK